MTDKKKILCLMLARGGSKSLPNKNLMPLNGRPLIYYTIKAVQESGCFDRFVLTTDSGEIARVAKDLGVEVPFMRPRELARDDSLGVDVIVHALKWIEANDGKYDYVQYIFPTAPLRTADDIRKGVEILLEKDADMVISVCEADHPRQWYNALPEDNSLRGFIKPEYFGKNRQDFPKAYRVNGSIYIGRWEIFYHRKNWFEQNTYAYIMPRERSIDIDSAIDLKLAELLMRGDKCI
jgi:N-acylneuraminate cytidylyltransferase/CMP-N,N'-diacetyllegionaminic acid synthase